MCANNSDDVLTDDQIEDFITAGRISGQAREYGARLVKEGVFLREVADAVEEFIIDQGAGIAFPVNLSINDAAAHYSPTHNDKTVFSLGDLVKVDVGAHVNGCIGDTAMTVEVGTQNQNNLILATEQALDAALSIMGPGVELQSVGTIIEQSIRSFGFKPISNLTGHKITPYSLHAGVNIPNINERVIATVKPGDIYAIEPFATDGGGMVMDREKGNIFMFKKPRKIGDPDTARLLTQIKEKSHGLPFSERWVESIMPNSRGLLNKLVRLQTVHSYSVLRDIAGGMVSQKEHTVLITDGGCRVLTRV